MGPLTSKVAGELADRRARHPGRPDLELLEHILVGLQRERVVSVGFDTARLGERLAKTTIPEEVRRIVLRAVGQVWLDENMHARYLMGILLAQKELSVKLSALGQHTEGGVAGWIVSVKQLGSGAGGEQAVATVLELAGKIAGKVPEEVQGGLSRMSLHDYFTFNADAEESAAISFDRMIDLVAEVRALLSDPAAGFEPAIAIDLPGGFDHELPRMSHDESMHQRVFEALAHAVGPDDGLAPGATATGLAERLAAVDPWLLPAELRPRVAESRDTNAKTPSPVGSGGTVVVSRGERPEAKLATFHRCLDDSGFFEHLDRRTREAGSSREHVRIAIKPDFMMAYHRSDRSSFTDPELVAALVERIHAEGYREIRVCDAQNVYARFYRNRDVASVARYIGLPGGPYRLVDLTLEQEPHVFRRGMGVYAIGRSWRDADVRVSFAKLKTHVTAAGALTVRNVGTAVPQFGEYFFDTRVSDFSNVCMAVLHDMPAHFGIIDGYENAADGLLGVMADPTPKHPRLFVAGVDVVSVDLVALRLMGEPAPREAEDMRAAIEWFGDPSSLISVLGDATPIPDWDRASAGARGALSRLAAPVYATLSMSGAMFAADMDLQAFPAIDETTPISIIRNLLRTGLSFGRPSG